MTSNGKHISICGIGPGSQDYITRVVRQQVDKAEVLIGGRRQLALFANRNKCTVVFDGKPANLKTQIDGLSGKNIVVLVSGDTGFYSLRRFLKEAFPTANIDLYPGISSYQYFYAKLGLGYEKAFLASMHGCEVDFIDKLNESASIFLLTDRKNNYQAIANKLFKNGLGHVKMHIGNNLSYPDENIVTVRAKQALQLTYDFPLCSVIIENPNLK